MVVERGSSPVEMPFDAAPHVVILRWPEESASIERLRRIGTPRLLLVAPDAPPPSTIDCVEDWIRLPAEDADVRARILTLEVRGTGRTRPEARGDGRLIFRGEWVALTGAEEAIVRLLADHFGELVDQDAVEGVAALGRPMSPNALRVSVSRLRKRIAPLGLVVRRVHNRGYVLESC